MNNIEEPEHAREEITTRKEPVHARGMAPLELLEPGILGNVSRFLDQKSWNAFDRTCKSIYSMRLPIELLDLKSNCIAACSFIKASVKRHLKVLNVVSGVHPECAINNTPIFYPAHPLDGAQIVDNILDNIMMAQMLHGLNNLDNEVQDLQDPIIQPNGYCYRLVDWFKNLRITRLIKDYILYGRNDVLSSSYMSGTIGAILGHIAGSVVYLTMANTDYKYIQNIIMIALTTFNGISAFAGFITVKILNTYWGVL